MRAAAWVLASVLISIDAGAAARVYRPSDPSQIVLELKQPVRPERIDSSFDATASFEMRIRQADALQRQHFFAEAESLLTEVLTQHPRHSEARLMRAQVRIHLRQGERALQDCAALAIVVDSLTTTACVAQVRALQGDPERAYALISTALNLRGANPAVRSWAAGIAGDLAAELGRHAEAGAWYEEMYRLEPENHYARLQYAQWLSARGRDDEAAKIATQGTLARSVTYRDSWLRLWTQRDSLP